MFDVVRIGGVECIGLACGTCGVHFAMPLVQYETHRKEGGYHTCPNGHSRGWSDRNCETAVDKIRRERDRLQQRQAQLQDQIEGERRRTAAAKGQVTKLKNRAAAGVCPCCNRSFVNLQRHMKTKHPDFAEGQKPDLKVVGKA
ncbi:hypothetical protein HBA54_19285 [Pelagibius litoralis]|uniref:C2H2-type domain-containing protein n=1 Tax=Pelagibius litoralis TaxID=374515 RepID=A0A967F0D4_9PROT|nr:hypothetical protein [Pelagibius litoralis]NIA70747.1 hypothetical protein [Pelagibius litoralis]